MGLKLYHLKVFLLLLLWVSKKKSYKRSLALKHPPPPQPTHSLCVPSVSLAILGPHSSNLCFSWSNTVFSASPISLHSQCSRPGTKGWHSVANTTLGASIKICPRNVLPVFRKHVHHILFVMFHNHVFSQVTGHDASKQRNKQSWVTKMNSKIIQVLDGLFSAHRCTAYSDYNVRGRPRPLYCEKVSTFY